MNSFGLFNRATAAMMAAQAAQLLIAPSIAVWMLSPDPRTVTSLETFFARSLALTQLVFAFLLLLFSGDLSFITSSNDIGEPGAPNISSPYAAATLLITTFYHAASCILLYTYSYSNFLSSIQLTLFSIVHLVMASGGLLLIMFGKDKGHISKRTGADKRTSNFPFTNAEAAKKKAR